MRPARNPLPLRAVIRSHFVDESILVGREVLIDAQCSVKRNEGHQVGRLHLGAQEILGGFDAALQVFGLHGG